ncbi:FAS1 domain-containing protein [Durusdinium trenchii]|uniref:FAS1 domain-containing protein n=1 Tax=Durusdinium trenchii TaxID=1381693 RepID=A0ABP0LQT7_9DINO
MQLAFVPRGARAVGVKLVGSGEQPASCSGETSCDNGLLHKLQRVLLPPMQGWQGFVGRGEARQKMQQADLEVLKERRLLNGRIRAGPPWAPGPVSRAVVARRTPSAHMLLDRQRPQAFAPLYGDDYEPTIYTGNKPLPPRRDESQLRAADAAADKAKPHRIHPSQAPTLEDVWEEWEPLQREEMRLQKELQGLQEYLRSKEAAIAEHSAFLREVLPESGISWRSRPKSRMEVTLQSKEEHQRLKSCLAPQDPKLITAELMLAGRRVPCYSRISSDFPSNWASHQTEMCVSIELPEALPGDTFAFWSVPPQSRGIESKLQHLEAQLLIEQSRTNRDNDVHTDSLDDTIFSNIQYVNIYYEP